MSSTRRIWTAAWLCVAAAHGLACGHDATTPVRSDIPDDEADAGERDAGDDPYGSDDGLPDDTEGGSERARPDAGSASRPRDRDAGGQPDARAPDASLACPLAPCMQLVTEVSAAVPIASGLTEACCVSRTTCGLRFVLLGDACIDPSTLIPDASGEPGALVPAGEAGVQPGASAPGSIGLSPGPDTDRADDDDGAGRPSSAGDVGGASVTGNAPGASAPTDSGGAPGSGSEPRVEPQREPSSTPGVTAVPGREPDASAGAGPASDPGSGSMPSATSGPAATPTRPSTTTVFEVPDGRRIYLDTSCPGVASPIAGIPDAPGCCRDDGHCGLSDHLLPVPVEQMMCMSYAEVRAVGLPISVPTEETPCTRGAP